MFKKIVCLALALLMVLPALVACSGGNALEDVVVTASSYTTSLNMWLITESKAVADASKVLLSGLTPDTKEKDMTEEQKAQLAAMTDAEKEAWEQVYAVTEAFNKITKAQFKTKVNMKFFLEEDYYAALEAAFNKHQEELDKNNGSLPTDKIEAGATVLNEYGVPELQYPNVHEFQADILFLGSYEKYTEFMRNGWLKDVTAQFEESALLLNTYMNSLLLRAVQKNGGSLYAFPNNHTVGEYVYVMADAKMMADYGTVNGTIYDTSFQNYLDYVYANYNSADNKIYPIYSEDGKVDVNYTHYWSFDLDSASNMAIQQHDRFSLFGSSYGGKIKLDNDNLLTSDTYMKMLAVKTHYENTEGYLTTDADAKAAIRIVKGGYELREQYEAEGYQVIAIKSPTLTDEEVFSSMFAMGKHTGEAGKAADVITYINTNAELRNILLYGVEGLNYEFDTEIIGDEECRYVVPTENNIYVMDVAKTGNEFLAYPNDPAKAKYAEYGKEQNLDMVKYPTLGLELDLVNYKLQEKQVRIMEAVSAELAVYLDSLTTASEVYALYNTAVVYKSNDAQMAAMLLSLVGEVTYTFEGATHTVNEKDLATAITVTKLNSINKKGEDPKQSTYALYLEWCTMNGIDISQ